MVDSPGLKMSFDIKGFDATVKVSSNVGHNNVAINHFDSLNKIVDLENVVDVD